METPKATNKTIPESPPINPNSNKTSSEAQIAAQKLDDLIEGQRKDAPGRRLERQHSRRITSLSSRRNLMAASPSMALRKTRSEALIKRNTSGYGFGKNPPSTDFSSPASLTGKKKLGDICESFRMSKTSENLQRDLEAKARARGLRSSSPSVQNVGESSPSVRNVEAKKPPPPPPKDGLETELLSGPRRQMSKGDFQPSRISHCTPKRLQDTDSSQLKDSTSSYEVQMGNTQSPSHNSTDSSTVSSRGTSGVMKSPGLLSQSSSVRRLPAPSFRRNNFARESSMSVLHRSATTADARDLDQLIAYKTGIPLQEDDEETQKPSAVLEGEDVSEENNVISQCLRATHATTPPLPTAGSLSGLTNNRDLDEVIAYKTGIPLQDSNGEDVEQAVQQVSPAVAKSQMAKNGDYTSSQMAKRPEIGAFAAGKDDPLDTDDDWITASDKEDLAIAIEVHEDDEDAYIPSAIEYDPEAKPPIYKNRRFRFYCGCFFVFVAAAAAGIVTIFKSQPDTPSEVDLPVEPTEAQSIMSTIELVVGEEKLADVDGPHYAALDWITNVDILQVGVADTGHLVQRYILALFHFQTSDWLQGGCSATDNSTNYTVGGDEGECIHQQLQSIMPSTYRSVPSYRWLSRKHECEWAGIRCDEDGYVRVIDLSGQYIRGKLPIEFKELRFLQSLLLSWNQLSGTVPEEYGNMQYLVSFEVGFNDLTGTLPTWSETHNLQLFNVGANSLTGTIPTSIKTMINLGGFYIWDNALRGTIPEEIGYMSTLKYIRLTRNMLTGTLPTTIGLLNPLELGLSNLKLSGPLPSELGRLVGLKNLRLQLTPWGGTIPEELFNLTALKRLHMYDCNLSGTLSTNVGKLTNLRELGMNDNKFTGTLPTELGTLPQLGDLSVHGNKFDGAVPLEVCSLKEFEGLEAVHADCLPMTSTNITQNPCNCCDTCCNSESQVCISVGDKTVE